MCALEHIHAHEDLVGLCAAEREALCREIRAFLIEHISQTGGHLASNLGVVELSVALETVYNTNIDRLVFDVGHQSYVHKLLTGRRADFGHLRRLGGMAGFPKPVESKTDAFTAGHASSSVSIALGMARARTLLGEQYDVVALIGDGAATGGMVYEALCDVGASREPIVVVLNDNEMSIAPNVGGFAQHLARLRTKESYLGLKQRYRDALSKNAFTQWVYRGTRRVKELLRRALLPTTIFETMGLTYLGPVDGNDVESMVSLLRRAKAMRRPVLVHVHTQKGRGYAPAEREPSKYHGVGKFDPAVGLVKQHAQETFSDAFGRCLTRLAAQDERICAITAAMPDGTGLSAFQAAFPDRLFDVGIAEEHAVSMAGGLAKQGMIPVVALYSTFLQRSYDQIMQDVALQRLHVVLAVDRAGLVGEDGETHHGVFDVGFLRQTPGMCVLAPCALSELEQMLRWAICDHDGPVAIRYPRGTEQCGATKDFCAERAIVCHRAGTDVALVTYGTMVHNVLQAACLLAERGISAAVYRLTRLAPLPAQELRQALDAFGCIVVVEEVCSGSGIRQDIAYLMQGRQIFGIDLGDRFPTHGTIDELYEHYHLDAASIAAYVAKECAHERGTT